ncbi:MAG: alpha/beta hydrolase [Acidimicrobiales bacterium]|nr:alpha/beta hydrolase [Acidimicrobiales bacterium]
MADVVLLHGGGFGPWSWDLVRPGLERLGHRTVAVSLPLDSEGLEAIASSAAEQAATSLDSDGPVVVGHALGCAVVPLVAGRLGARAMIWVCGVVPVPGLSCADLIAADPTMIPMWDGSGRRELLEEGADGIPAAVLDRMADDLFPDADPSVRAWALAHIREDGVPPRGGVNAVSDRFPADGWPAIPAASVIGRDDRALSPSWSRAAASARLGAEPVELPGDHTPLLSRPDELVAVLERMIAAGDRSVGPPTGQPRR